MKSKSIPTWISYLTTLVSGAVFLYYVAELSLNIINYPDTNSFLISAYGLFDFSEVDFQILDNLRSAGFFLALLCVLVLIKTGGINWRNWASLLAVLGLTLSYLIWLFSALLVFLISYIFLFEPRIPEFYEAQASKDAAIFILFHVIGLPLFLLFLLRYWYLSEQKIKRPVKKGGAWRLE